MNKSKEDLSELYLQVGYLMGLYSTLQEWTKLTIENNTIELIEKELSKVDKNLIIIIKKLTDIIEEIKCKV